MLLVTVSAGCRLWLLVLTSRGVNYPRIKWGRASLSIGANLHSQIDAPQFLRDEGLLSGPPLTHGRIPSTGLRPALAFKPLSVLVLRGAEAQT